MQRLRAITYLSPGLPLGLFEGLTGLLGEFLGQEVELQSETSISGPMEGDHDPFLAGEVDIGFVCSPSYLYLSSKDEPSVTLAPAGFAFEHPSAEGQPVYFADVVVSQAGSIHGIEGLRGGRWGFNDRCSLSGHFAIRQHLHEAGETGPFFGSEVHTGCHQESVRAILEGRIEAASVDSTTLAILRRQDPELAAELRVIQSLGPFPIQPIVLSQHLDPAWSHAIGAALQQLHMAPGFEVLRRDYGLSQLVPIERADYAEEHEALSNLGQLPPVVDRSCADIVRGLYPS